MTFMTGSVEVTGYLRQEPTKRADAQLGEGLLNITNC